MMRDSDIAGRTSITTRIQATSKQRKSSIVTDSTAGSTELSNSASDFHHRPGGGVCYTGNNSKSPTQNMMSPEAPGSSGSSRKKKLDNESRKKLLMELVKNEMMCAWDDLQEEDEEASALIASVTSSVNNNNEDLQPEVSSADMFYAMMNGEQVNPGPTMTLLGVMDGGYCHYGAEDDKTENTFDQTSFANLVFSPDDMSSPTSRRRPSSKTPKRRSLDCNSLAVTKSIEGSFDLPFDDSYGSHPSRSSHPSSQTESNASLLGGSDGLSVREIEKFVVANMPKHVRDQIPEEAWGRIFRTSSQRTTESKFEYDEMVTREEMETPEEEFDDNITSVSDITERTHFIDARNGLRSPRSPGGNRRETRWESDDSPPELSPTGWSSDSHSGGEDSAVPRSPSRVEPSKEVQPAVKSKNTIKEFDAKVSFDNVQVRYYERILDINPAVTNGAAIGIGWRYKRGGSLSIEDWEQRRGDTRQANDLLLPKHVREAMLKDLGYSQHDIAAAVRHILKAKNRRKQTVENLGAEPLEEAVESARRKVKSILTLGIKKGLIKSSSRNA